MTLFSLKESARRKKVNSTEREVGVEDVEDVTVFIMEHLSFIKNWIVQRANSLPETPKIVTF